MESNRMNRDGMESSDNRWISMAMNDVNGMEWNRVE